jgi:RND family efflux transporter MFP subunit
MNHKRPPVPVIVLLALALLVGGYFVVRSLVDNGDSALTASGTIEVVEVSIAPEIGGRVVEVYVEEGETVAAGDALFRLDDALLQAQRAVAAAALDTAEAAAAIAEAAVVTARAQYDLAADARAEAAVRQADAAANQAALAVTQAEASLALIDVQIAKLTVVAPSDGVVLTRSIEPGEVVSPAAVSIVIGRLADTTITVYVPEDRYGEIALGQAATVTVDSFPGQTFEATVSYIAGQAEFTPRNVQTAEGRSSTVYAIRLQVEDPEGNLKPGMPADVTFER